MGLLLVLLFIVVPIAELYVIIQVGQLVGIGPTLLILLLDSVVGAWLLKREGRSAWGRFNRALAERRLPGKEVADGFLIVLGGALLVAPGFITDLVGVLLLVPPSRAVARRVLRRWTLGRVAVVGFPGGATTGGFGAGRGPGAGGGSGAGRDGGAGRSYDFDAEAEEVGENDGWDHRLPPAEG